MTAFHDFLRSAWSRVLGAFLVLLLAVAWIASGVMTREPPAPAAERKPEPMRVVVETLEAERIERILTLQGRVDPDLRITVRAETAGQVEAWKVTRGQRVAADEEMVRLRMDDREARRRQAIANLRGRESEYEATKRLVEDGHAPRINLDAREAELEAARAELEAIELDIRNTRIRAPVDGIVNRRIVERGDYVPVGEGVVEIVDNDPLVAVVQVPQHQVGRVASGQTARIRFMDGRQAEGEVRFVAAVAEPGTRTFRVEAEVPNPERELPSGLSATVEIPTGRVAAHALSPAVISLDDEGRIGVKTVDEDHRVVFHPVEVVRTAPTSVWVTGLPERARVITVGQGFVSAGEEVRTGEPR